MTSRKLVLDDIADLSFKFNAAPFQAHTLMRVEGIEFGYDGTFQKVTSLRTGNNVYLCEPDDDGHGDHDHDTPVVCDDQSGNDPHTLGLVDTVDPHGLKSLSYLTGGF